MLRSLDTLKLAVMDLDSLLTESFWGDFGTVFHIDSLVNIFCRCGPELEPTHLFAPIILGYTEDEEIAIHFIYSSVFNRYEARVIWEGEMVSPKKAMQMLFSFKGKPRSLTPHGVLSSILTDLERRVLCAKENAELLRLDSVVIKIYGLTDVYRYGVYFKLLRVRYEQAPIFIPKSWFDYVCVRLRIAFL